MKQFAHQPWIDQPSPAASARHVARELTDGAHHSADPAARNTLNNEARNWQTIAETLQQLDL